MYLGGELGREIGGLTRELRQLFSRYPRFNLLPPNPLTWQPFTAVMIWQHAPKNVARNKGESALNV